MTRRKHNGRCRTHMPVSIEYMGKADSAYVRCTCGYLDHVAVWYSIVPGFDVDVLPAVRTFLDAWAEPSEVL